MMIILSPSKTMDSKKTSYLEDTMPINGQKSMNLRKKIKKWSKKTMQKIMKLSDKQIEEVYDIYHNEAALEEGHAIMTYTGFVYKKLSIPAYKKAEFAYLEKHVRILDALYGILKPSTLIKPYRLDFLMNIGENLYDYWSVQDVLKGQVILNLASNEYSQMLKGLDLINVSFLQTKNGGYKNIATYTKQARGSLLDYMVLNKVTDLQTIKAFKADGYAYNEDLSSAKELVFTR